MLFRGFLILVLFGINIVAGQPMYMEDAFKANTSGAQVVETVVDIIAGTCVLDNEVFLRRIAHVETDDGSDPQTYRAGYHGGIWNVDEAMFQETKDNDRLQPEYHIIKEKLSIDWSNVTWSDLREPIKSALAVALLLKVKHFQAVPENLEIQATIWQSLNPNRNPAFQFVSKEYLESVVCESGKMLDLVVVLNFHSTDISDLIQFMKALFGSFDLAMDSTRVGILTQKGSQPAAAWYLNSQRGGYTVLNSLVALKYESGAPLPVNVSLKWAREEMFNGSQGARSGASKVLILITDDLSKSDHVTAEAKMLKEAGIHLMVLKVSNSTSIRGLGGLVPNPTCQNAKIGKSFSELESLKERLTTQICKVPALLDTGRYTFPCQYNLSARLPDTSKAYHVLVEPDSGNITFFASKTYRHPDESSYDARLVSMAATGSVLYARGSDPMYLQVRGQETSCTGNYTVEIRKTVSFERKSGVCFVAGTVRKCDDLMMDLITNDVVLVRDPDGPFLCDPKNQSLERYPHPVDTEKFYLCDRDDSTYLGLCPVMLPGCTQFTSGCKYTNPCTKEALLTGEMEHIDPCAEANVHVTCTHQGVAEVMHCPTYRMWNEDTKHCVSEYVHDPRTNTFYKNITNPCIHSHEEHAYFPFPSNPAMYIFCDLHGDAFASTCRVGVWNEQMKSCTEKSAQLLG